jgi:hypothetical protein
LTDTLRIALAVLVCYRLSELVAVDDGPYRIFSRFRGRLDDFGVVQDTLVYDMAELVSCPYCLGVWFGLLCAVLVQFRIDSVLVVIGIAGGQCVLRDLTRGRE